MHVLIVAATSFEVDQLISDFGFQIPEFEIRNQPAYTLTTHNSQFTIIITGVGMVATAFALGRQLATGKYDLGINLGIAGSFDRNIALGEVIEITEDTLSEFGAEDHSDFLTIETLGFGESVFPSTYRLSDHFAIKKATAITVNTVHGNEGSIKTLTSRIQPQMESMEGAAFFYACRQANVPCVQIRAVSNYVEKRNRDSWQIGLAIKNLNTFATEFLKSLYA